MIKWQHITLKDIGIDQFYVSAQRGDVGSNQFVRLHARWDNGSDVGGGSIKINGEGLQFNSTDWVQLSDTSSVAARAIIYTIVSVIVLNIISHVINPGVFSFTGLFLASVIVSVFSVVGVFLEAKFAPKSTNTSPTS